MQKSELLLLLVKADLIERIVTEDGVNLLYGVDGKYIEVFSANDPTIPFEANVVTDLNRLLRYAEEMENPYKFKRPESGFDEDWE